MALEGSISTSQRFPRASGSYAEPAFEPLAIRPLLHPTEVSRFVLAVAALLVVCAVVVAAFIAAKQPLGLAVVLGFLLAFVGLFWIGLQIHRATLLGRCIRVTRRSLPEVQDALDQIRVQLDYHRPIDVYISAKEKKPATILSYLGTKIIVLEGNLVGDLLPRDQRPQLTFLLARFVGAFKARHMRFDVIALLISAVQEVKVLNLFLNPYYRATTYSGDQIGLASCGDLDTALRATTRLMTGKDVEPAVAAAGVLDQAAVVSHRWLPRLAQVVAPEPHLTNRYLNLLFHAKAHDPAAWSAFVRALDDRTAAGLEALSTRSPHAWSGSAPPAVSATTIAESDWASDTGVVCSALAAVAAAGLFAGGVFAAEGSLGQIDTVVLVCDGLLVAGLLVAALATLVRRNALGRIPAALLAASLAGWAGLLPVLDAALDEFQDVTLSTWLVQGAAAAAIAAAVGLTASKGRIAVPIRKSPRRASRWCGIGAALAGGLVIAATFLPVYRFGSDEVNLWETYPGSYDASVVAMAGGLTLVAFGAALLKSPMLPWLTTIFAGATFWLVFSPGDIGQDYSLLSGWWLALGGAACAFALGLLGWLLAGARTETSAALVPPPQVSAAELPGQLERLAELHRKGLLDDDELAAAKARILTGTR